MLAYYDGYNFETDVFFIGYDDSYCIEYHNSWSDYEEAAWIFIFSKDNRFYLLEDHTGPFSYDSGPPSNFEEKQEISYEESLNIIEDWEND